MKKFIGANYSNTETPASDDDPGAGPVFRYHPRGHGLRASQRERARLAWCALAAIACPMRAPDKGCNGIGATGSMAYEALTYYGA